MPIEQALQDATRAINELIAALRAQNHTAGDMTRNATINEGAVVPEHTATSLDVAGGAPTTAVEYPPTLPVEISYDQVRETVTHKLMKPPFGREATVGLLKEFGVGNAKELKPEQYADFVRRAEQIIAAGC